MWKWGDQVEKSFSKMETSWVDERMGPLFAQEKGKDGSCLDVDEIGEDEEIRAMVKGDKKKVDFR